MDKIYTPRHFAQQLAAAARSLSPALIADFTAGDGALLIAARERWPSARFYAFDIDPSALESLSNVLHGVQTSRIDFLNDHAREECAPLASLRSKCDLVLLNPPFSCRGASVSKVKVGDKIFSCSTATSFFVRGLEYISKKGEMIAILPSSCVTSQRDRGIFSTLDQAFCIDQVGGIHKSVFQGHSVAVVVLRVCRRESGLKQNHEAVHHDASAARQDIKVKILRGTFPVHFCNSRPGDYALIHTCNLKFGKIAGERARVAAWSRHVHGPAVLIPRVGKPDINKVVLRSSEDNIIISDCLFALTTSPKGHESDLWSLIVENWHILESMYSGSCAPYITLKQIEYFLLNLRFVCDVIKGRTATSGLENEMVGSVRASNEQVLPPRAPHVEGQFHEDVAA